MNRTSSESHTFSHTAVNKAASQLYKPVKIHRSSSWFTASSASYCSMLLAQMLNIQLCTVGSCRPSLSLSLSQCLCFTWAITPHHTCLPAFHTPTLIPSVRSPVHFLTLTTYTSPFRFSTPSMRGHHSRASAPSLPSSSVTPTLCRSSFTVSTKNAPNRHQSTNTECTGVTQSMQMSLNTLSTHQNKLI